MSRTFTREVKRLALDRCDHQCEGKKCGLRLAGRRYQFDHVIPWELSQDSSLDNCQVLCVSCHLDKTILDAAVIAKTRRVADRHLGIAGPGLGRRPMRGGRRSRERKTFRHGVQPRVTLAQEHLRIMQKRYGRG